MLKAPEVPSVLLELGYLSNKDDEKLFKSDDWPAEEAETVARAIEGFFGGKARRPASRAAQLHLHNIQTTSLQTAGEPPESSGVLPQFDHKTAGCDRAAARPDSAKAP